MKEIKAFIPILRITAVTEALRSSGVCDISAGKGCYNITVSQVQRLHSDADPRRQQYSVTLAEPVVAETKLELICADEFVDQLVELIAGAARTGRPDAGWIFVSDIQRSVPIGTASST